jgi:hypothetical protein
MLANITNLNTEYSDCTILIDPSDSWTTDKTMSVLLSRLLANYSEYCEEYPSDFTSLEEWKMEVNYHSDCLSEYFYCQDSDNAEFEAILKDTKKSFKFISEYLEDLWIANE